MGVPKGVVGWQRWQQQRSPCGAMELGAGWCHLPAAPQPAFCFGLDQRGMGARVLCLESAQMKLSKEAFPTDCTYQINGIHLILLLLPLMCDKKLLAGLGPAHC